MTALRGAIVPVTPLQQNCALLWDDESKQACVVDPGGDVARICGAIDELGLTVERILLTHCHIDHAAGAAELRDRLGVPIEGPDERDAFLLRSLAENAPRYGISGARDVEPDRLLHEGDTVDIGPHRFAVLHCPGHSPGHVVFVNEEAGFAVLGDVLFNGSVGRTDFPYSDTDALFAAIRDKIMKLPDAMSFICGHGPGSTIGAERRSNPFVIEALGGPAARA